MLGDNRSIVLSALMKIYLSPLIVTIWLLTHLGVLAIDPAEVNGAVTLDVDQSKPVWSVKVTNHSTEKLRYEMMGKVPRGLGMEVWDLDNKHGGLRIHAENLADYLNVDGFPADLREIAPGKSETFLLDPKSMSTTNDTTHAQWERAKRIGYYECRVFFGIYASRLTRVSPTDNAGNKRESKTSEPAWLSDVIKDPKEKVLVGIRLRQLLNEEKRSLIHWNRGSDRKDEYYIEYTTCAKAGFDKMAPWDGSKPLEMAMHELVTRAKAIAHQKGDTFKAATLVAVVIEPCEDDSTKHYASIAFDGDDDNDDINIELLLNGAPLKSTRLRVTEKQYEELSEYGIP